MSTDNPTPDDETSDFVGGSGSRLDGLTEFVGLKPATPGEDILIGVQLGDVTIVRLIAEGGMGRVYEGVQVRPNRTVAVKVMRPGLANQTLLKRFEFEAELLGRLQHPGIGQIYSAGVHSLAGVSVPYFVMEYITDAKTLTAYAEERRLPTQDRLTVFRQVCDAVTHGHQKGVIHRDLKPSNILVDSSGQPKVIDFGIAKATEADIALTTIQTDVGQLVGTFQYMSPEQFDANPNNIDIRTDVYALGVVLYELLTGQPPYDVRKKAVYEAMRIVKEEDPTPISHLNKTLRRDIAIIAAKCLEKDKSRRYSSASEVADDVSRYLAGEPIRAAPPSLWDGVLRLARRHRIAALASAVVFSAVLVSSAAIGIFAVRARRERDSALAQEAIAVTERDRSQRLLSFLIDSIHGSDAWASTRDVTVQDMLSSMSESIPQRFADDQQLQARMFETVGQVLHSNGKYAAAQPLLEKAIAIWERRIADGRKEDQQHLQNALQVLGNLHRRKYEYDQAASLIERAVAVCAAFYGENHVRTAHARVTLAGVVRERGDHKRAETILRNLLPVIENHYGTLHRESASILTHLAFTLAAQGKIAEAEIAYRDSLARLESALGTRDAHCGAAKMHLGVLLAGQRRWPEAREMLNQALAIAESTVGPDNPFVSEVLEHVGEVHIAEHRYDDAAQCFSRAIAIREQALGADNNQIVQLSRRLGAAYQALGREEDSNRALVRAASLERSLKARKSP